MNKSDLKLDFETTFGTRNLYWKLSGDSNALELAGEKAGDILVAELPAFVADDLRTLTGVTASRIVQVELFGETFDLHLVGRKVDGNTWTGNGAQFGDTEAVARGLENSLAFAEQVVSEVNSLVIIIDSEKRIRRFNHLCEELSGVKEAQVLGKHALNLFINESHRENTLAGVNDFFQNEKTFETIRAINSKIGVRTIKWRNTIMQSGNGAKEKFLVCSGTDITEELTAQARLEELANKDVLTGLPNRHAIQQKINAAVSTPDAPAFGVIFLDLDNFKKVNDHFGHGTGDSLIKAVSETIAGCLNEGDTLARLGGDEFLIMVSDPNQKASEETAQRILERMKHPFQLTRAEVYTGCSIGIAMYPEHGDGLDALIRSADTAMYVAKDDGRRTVRVYSKAMDAKIAEYMWLDTNMRRALEENQFELFYQPKVSLATGAVDSVEALLRWHHPERGLVAPNSFIPYAEESGLIVPLGQWVMNAAAVQAGQWKRDGLDIRIAINLSARQLRIPTLVEDFTTAIVRNNVLPSMIDLELTESCLMEDEMRANTLISRFRELGSEVHLDDFGTGYSSLSQLSRLPLDVLKLDGSFITSIQTDEKARALVRSMVAVAHQMNLKIVAECVETEEQADFLRDIGVDYAQGYLYGKPMRCADFEAWLVRQAQKQLKFAA